MEKNIFLNNPIDIKGIFIKYNLSSDTVTNISIGYDNKVYILFSESVLDEDQESCNNTEEKKKYNIVILTVDWINGTLLQDECLDFGILTKNYYFVQPIEKDILLLDARCHKTENSAEKNAVIFSKSSEIKREFCLGDGIQDCIVLENGNIVTSYFDEGIFGNYGWNYPIGSCGLIIWDKNGNSIWKAPKKYDIIDGYALNIDEKNNIWFYFHDSKLEYNFLITDCIQNTVYKTELKDGEHFLITKDKEHIIMDGGYNKHSEFITLNIDKEKVNQYSKTDCYYNQKLLILKKFVFRSAKAVFWDNQNQFFVFEINTL